MKTIIILALEGTAATTVSGPADFFSGTGILWNTIMGIPLKPYFRVKIAAQDGSSVTCSNGIKLGCELDIDQVKSADLVIIPSIFKIQSTIEKHQKLIEWLKFMHAGGSDIASICTGAFILAGTGLLNGKKATTHWGVVSQFRSMFPQVELLPEQILIDEGQVLTSGGANAGFDLSLYLIERYCGKEIALKNARFFLQDSGRKLQTPYQEMQINTAHADVQIKEVQTWMSTNLHQVVGLSELARMSGYSLRTFERRFKKATGEAPLTYLQKLKVQKAKNMLLTTSMSFDEISYQLGYQNSGSFRKVFVKNADILPSEYRTKFQRIL